MAGGVPFVLFAAFQLMFAAITPALITGAFAERKRFASFVVFTILWSIFVYSPIAHWVWAKRRLALRSGRARLRGWHRRPRLVRCLRPDRRPAHRQARRQRRPDGAARHPDDRPRRGASWFLAGFNAGSELAADGIAANALLTNTAAAAATITWVLASYLHHGKVSVVGAACGAVAGLVAITPASGFVTAGGAVIIGLSAAHLLQLHAPPLVPQDRRRTRRVRGPRCRRRYRCDRHGRLRDHGDQLRQRPHQRQPEQVWTQIVAVGVIAYAVVATFVIVKVTGLVLGIRVKSDQEEVGLDLAVHGEVAYQP